MGVPHSEGVANHTDPLSCVGYREVSGQRRPAIDADAVLGAEGNMDGRDIAKVRTNPAWSETLACAETARCVGAGAKVTRVGCCKPALTGPSRHAFATRKTNPNYQLIKQRRLVFTDENGSLCASLGSLTAKRQVSFYSQKF